MHETAIGPDKLGRLKVEENEQVLKKKGPKSLQV